MKKKILILSHSSLYKDPRILRQIRALGSDNIITTCGLASSKLEEEQAFINIKHSFNNKILRWVVILGYIYPLIVLNKIHFFHRFRFYTLYYWNLNLRIVRKKLATHKFDIIIANDINMLPLGVWLKKNCNAKLIFDAHEYSPLEIENDTRWLKWDSPYIIFLTKKFVPQTDYCYTVGSKIAEVYQNLTSVKFDLIYNAPIHNNKLYPIINQTDIIKVVHHGAAMKDRNLHIMINCFKLLPKHFHLYFFLVNSEPQYYLYLMDLAKGSINIHFCDPVPTELIPQQLNCFDIGLSYIAPLNFNYKYCLPNKFFEFVQARLMIISGPSPEMKYIIEKYQIGLVSKGFDASDLYDTLKNISREQIAYFKNKVNIASWELSGTASMNSLVNKVNDLCAV